MESAYISINIISSMFFFSNVVIKIKLISIEIFKFTTCFEWT